jgi:hypothetical protein
VAIIEDLTESSILSMALRRKARITLMSIEIPLRGFPEQKFLVYITLSVPQLEKMANRLELVTYDSNEPM